MVCFQYKVRFRYNFWVIRIMRWQYFEFIPCVESMADEHFSAQKRVTWIPESFSEIFHWGTSNFSDFDIVANDLTSYDQKWPDSSSWIPRFLYRSWIILEDSRSREVKKIFQKSIPHRDSFFPISSKTASEWYPSLPQGIKHFGFCFTCKIHVNSGKWLDKIWPKTRKIILGFGTMGYLLFDPFSWNSNVAYFNCF